ncbi:hypothetical protein BVC80_8091g6 [Macleaya cordata]|uniref:Zinc finger protein n=1 Tax=Macleaya cordata TaxID=56857 RepID=A0A200Q0U6_MACCD|nr:hypothetical protein BVC80_8091g6 [Macleaya cordata]
MYRAAFTSSSTYYSPRWQETWAWLLAPLTLWIFSVSLRYGSYGNSNLVLGPNSSRLFKASSIFVQQIQIRDDDKTGVFVYGFSEKPKLSLETNNWNFSRYVLVGPYRRQGFSLWLNKGSMLRMKWTAHVSDFDDLVVVLYKGQRDLETVLPVTTPTNSIILSNSTHGNAQAEYLISEDDNHYICILNMNPRNIIMGIDVNVSSTMYDTSKAKSNCSTINGFCQLNLLFPKQHFIILATPNNGDLNGWYIELSFIARLVTYVAVLGLLVIFISLILKYMIACERDRPVEEVNRVTEADPLMPASGKAISFTYGTGEEDTESGMCNSSEDLYDGKICVICYDVERNCFFVPCGHCATCYPCAQRYNAAFLGMFGRVEMAEGV